MRAPPPPKAAAPGRVRALQLHLVSVLESPSAVEIGGEAGEVALDTSCKPDPVALLKTQDLLQQCKSQAQAAGVANVRLTTLVSCVGGSADTVRSAVLCAAWHGV